MTLKKINALSFLFFVISFCFVTNAYAYYGDFLNNTNWNGQITDETTGKKSTISLHLATQYVPEITQVAGTVTIDSVSYPFSFGSSDCVSGYGVPYMIRIAVPYQNSVFQFGYSVDSAANTTLSSNWIYISNGGDNYFSTPLTKNN